MKKLLVVGLIVFVVVLLVWQFTGLRRSEDRIRTSILELTPIGITPDTVLAVIESHGWRSYGLQSTGFYRQDRIHQDVVATISIRASLGDYHGLPLPILVTNVTAF